MHYVIIAISTYNDTVSVEPIGVYSSLENAVKYINELKKFNSTYVFDVLEYEVDCAPHLLNFLNKEKESYENMIEEDIMNLMNQGLLDQLIGEDGHFYYSITEKGKKYLNDNNTKKNFDKLFKKKK